MKILVQNGFCHKTADIGKSEMLAIFHGMASCGSFFKMHGVNPDHRCGHHAEVKVIDDGSRIPALSFGASDLLFEFLETGFNLPAGAVVFDDVFDGKSKVGTEKGDPSSFAKDPHDAHRAFESFEHDNLIKSLHLSGSAVAVDAVCFSERAVFGRER